MTTPRKLSSIAYDIADDWQSVNFAAKPYLSAMATLDSIEDNYGYDSAKSVVLYFLSNAGTWHGENARRIKAELKALT